MNQYSSKALVTQEAQPVVTAAPQPSGPTTAQMLQTVLSGAITADKVDTAKSLMEMIEREEARSAEKAFAQAFNALQSETPNIQAIRPVPGNDGSIRYRFAPYEDIMRQVQPLLQRHGFTVTFSTRFEEGRIVKSCTLQHVSGHKRTNEFAVRIGKGPPGSTESQGDGAASTYAKRFALCDALNIVIDHDVDARAEGGTVTEEQAEELARRVAETNSNREAFLKFAGAKSFKEIAATKYAILDGFLRKKENPKV